MTAGHADARPSSPRPTCSGSRSPTPKGRRSTRSALLNPKALEEAAKRSTPSAPPGTVRGPLHGIPVMVKDNLDAAGLPDHRGLASRSRTASRTKDSPVVAKLRAAGAILLGKPNLSEFANFLTNGMPSGYCSLGGQVLNPYNADITPSGSSSGSGAAAAAGLAAITIGTETSGSIVSPVRRAGHRRAAADDRARVAHRHPPDQRHAGHGRPDDPHGRRRGGRAAARSPARTRRTRPPTAPATGPGLPRGPEARRRWPASGSASSPTPTRSTSRRSRRSRRSARRRCRSPRRPRPAPVDILTPEFKRDLNAYLGRLPASAPMKSLHGHHRLQRRPRRRRAQVRPDAADRQRRRPTSPTRRRTPPTSRRATTAAPRRAAGDRHRCAARRPADDVEAIMTPAGTLTGIGARAGYPQLVVPAGYAAATRDPVGHRVQRHGLQRGQAARVRLRLRAGDEAAQAAERDQPEPVALRARQRVHGHDARVRAERARQRGRHRGDRSAARCRRRSRSRSARRRRFGAFTPGVAQELHGLDHRERHLHRGRRRRR